MSSSASGGRRSGKLDVGTVEVESQSSWLTAEGDEFCVKTAGGVTPRASGGEKAPCVRHRPPRFKGGWSENPKENHQNQTQLEDQKANQQNE